MLEQGSSPEHEPRTLSRREALKRGAVLGGTMLWVTPAVQVLSISEAAAEPPSGLPGGGRAGNGSPQGPPRGRPFR